MLHWSGENLTCRHRQCVGRLIDRLDAICHVLDIDGERHTVEEVVRTAPILDFVGYYHALRDRHSPKLDAIDAALNKLRQNPAQGLRRYGQTLRILVPSLPPSFTTSLIKTIGGLQPCRQLADAILDTRILSVASWRPKLIGIVAAEIDTARLDITSLADLFDAVPPDAVPF